jgi:hypothetical protein
MQMIRAVALDKDRQPWLVFLLALFARLGVWWYSLPVLPSAITPDSIGYRQLAEALTNGHFPSLIRTPGYPLFLSLIGGFTESGLNTIFFAQSVLDAVTALLLTKIAWHYWGQWRAALLGGLWWVFNPVAINATTFVMTETLFMFLVVAALFLALCRQSWSSVVLQGACWAAATLTRPAGILLPLIVLVFLLLKTKNGFEARRKLATALVIYWVCVGGWSYFNYSRAGVFKLATISDVVIYSHELSAVRMLDHYGWGEYARLWLLQQSKAEPLRETFQSVFAAEMRAQNPTVPLNLYADWERMATVQFLRAEADRQLHGRLLARVYTHLIGAIQTIRPVLRWPRGGWAMTMLDCARLAILIGALVVLIYRREWWLSAFLLTWTAYGLLLPGVAGLWRFRSMAEPAWALAVTAACVQLAQSSWLFVKTPPKAANNDGALELG